MQEAVYVPSAQHAKDPEDPGKGYTHGRRFIGVTSEHIRRRNLQRYNNSPYMVKKREAEMASTGAAEQIKAALAMAQAGSLANRRAA